MSNGDHTGFRGHAMLKRVAAVSRRMTARLAEDDKKLHIRWSFWLTLAAHLFWPLVWAVTAVMALGLAKEYWDHRHGSGFCYIDIAGNLVGITGAVIISLMLPQSVFG